MRVLAVSLEEAKLYLRVDGGEEDALIAALIETASELCEGVLRMSLEDFEEIPKSVNQAILYITANLYEHREELDMKVVEDVVKRLLSPFRKEGW
ncbi:head-tail connector protein [Syntrophomonas erecta]